MSAQDYPVMFSRGRAQPSLARWPFAQLLVQTTWSALVEIQRRHELWKLTNLDDAQLRDYGVTRAELVAALESSLAVNATKLIEKARASHARAGR
ncbi:MAG: hypothetical protein AAF940_02015 [Pseudomonadota bacterium]